MSWVCPHCNTAAIINEDNVAKAGINIDSVEGFLKYELQGIVCPNPTCKKASINLRTEELANLYGQLTTIYGTSRFKRVIPSQQKERAKNYPSYIPSPIMDDYREACAIADLSPKASATLSRRCLQGMIRDFWGGKW